MIQPIFDSYKNKNFKLKTQVIIGYKAEIIIKILALSGSIILHFLSELEGPSLPMKLIVAPEGPICN